MLWVWLALSGTCSLVVIILLLVVVLRSDQPQKKLVTTALISFVLSLGFFLVAVYVFLFRSKTQRYIGIPLTKDTIWPLIRGGTIL